MSGSWIVKMSWRTLLPTIRSREFMKEEESPINGYRASIQPTIRLWDENTFTTVIDVSAIFSAVTVISKSILYSKLISTGVTIQSVPLS